MRAIGAIAALAALLTALTPGLAAAEPGGGRSGPQVSLVLTEVSPSVARPSGRDGRIVVKGTLRNTSGRALQGVSVRLRTSATRMVSRSQLAQYADGSPSGLRGLPAHKRMAKVDGPRGTQPFSLNTTTKELGLTEFGVYPIGVEVVNRFGQPLAGVTTFFTFVPKDPGFEPLKVSWVWPLVGDQHRAADDTFIDDRLAAATAAGGRLDGLVDAASATKVPLTWAVDPALLDDTARMAGGAYTVRAPDEDKGTRKPASKSARVWLAALRTAAKDDPYFALPYADPDVVALVRHEMSGNIGDAYSHVSVASDVMGRAPTATVAWPPNGMAGPGTLTSLARYANLKDGTFLLESGSFAPPPQGYTPDATTAVSTDRGVKKALSYDAGLSRIVSGDTRSPGSAVLARQRFLAETAMITAEAPELARGVVVAPDRRWNPSPGFARALLERTANVPWMKPVPLDKAIGGKGRQRVFRGYPDAMERHELGPRFLSEVQEISRDARRFSGVMYPPIKLQYGRAVLRMQSSAWRGSYRKALAARHELAGSLEHDRDQVKVILPDNHRVTLAGDSGRFPLTIANELADQTVEIRLKLTPENSAKLRIGEIDEPVIRLGPGQVVTKQIPAVAQAVGTGDFKVHIQLLTREGRPFDQGETITVRTTTYGRVALLITGGGLAVLFVGVGVRAIRARRRRKAEDTGDGATGTGSERDRSPGPRLPSTGGHLTGDDAPEYDPARFEALDYHAGGGFDPGARSGASTPDAWSADVGEPEDAASGAWLSAPPGDGDRDGAGWPDPGPSDPGPGGRDQD